MCVGRGCQDYKQKNDAKWGFIDKGGAPVIPAQFSQVEDFSEGLAGMCVGCPNGKWGFIDKAGKFVINPQYDSVWPFDHGFAQVRVGACDFDKHSDENCKFGYIGRTGKYLWAPSN